MWAIEYVSSADASDIFEAFGTDIHARSLSAILTATLRHRIIRHYVLMICAQ